jgi:hypothetical protein
MGESKKEVVRTNSLAVEKDSEASQGEFASLLVIIK